MVRPSHNLFASLQTNPNLPDGTQDLPSPQPVHQTLAPGNGVPVNGKEGERVSTRGMAVELRDVSFGYTGGLLPVSDFQ